LSSYSPLFCPTPLFADPHPVINFLLLPRLLGCCDCCDYCLVPLFLYGVAPVKPRISH
jgi:hypothetical protein